MAAKIDNDNKEEEKNEASSVPFSLTSTRKEEKYDSLVADLMLSMVAGALNSIRADSILRPFPPFQKIEAQRDHDELRKIIASLGKIDQVLKGMSNGTLTPQTTNVLKWFLTPNKFSLVPVPVDAVLAQASLGSAPKPTHAFELVWKEPYETRFASLKATYNSFIGFHGSAFENFYSILHNGLNNHLTKQTNLYGEGIYLSQDLSIALAFARGSISWKKSQFGHLPIAVVAGEIINHPDVQTTTRSSAKDEHGNRLPEKYFVVKNNEHVRVKYIVVYADIASLSARPFLSFNSGWFYAFIYIALLIALSLSSAENRAELVAWFRPFTKFFRTSF